MNFASSSQMELKYKTGGVAMNISKRYSIELNKISNHLADLERRHCRSA